MTRWLLFILMIASVVLMRPPAANSQAPPPSLPRSRPRQLPITDSSQAGSVTTGQATAPSASGSTVNTLNSTIQIQGAYQGSTPDGMATKDALPLTLEEAVRRGLSYNLGIIGARQIEDQARAQRLSALAQLLPDITGTADAAVEKTSLATVGLQSVRGLPSGFAFGRVL